MQAHEPPPPVRMVELLGGFRISQALYTAAALGVADQIVAGPAPVKASPNVSAPTRRPRTACCAHWPAWACSPNPSPVSSP